MILNKKKMDTYNYNQEEKVEISGLHDAKRGLREIDTLRMY